MQRALDHNDLGADLHPLIEIGDVLVAHADAAGGNAVADRPEQQAGERDADDQGHASRQMPAEALKLTLDPLGEHRLSTLQPAPGGVVIAIGPEGGWSPRDRQALAEAGFQGLQLGPHILRTETAGLAAIAAVQARLGDLG